MIAQLGERAPEVLQVYTAQGRWFKPGSGHILLLRTAAFFSLLAWSPVSIRLPIVCRKFCRVLKETLGYSMPTYRVAGKVPYSSSKNYTQTDLGPHSLLPSGDDENSDVAVVKSPALDYGPPTVPMPGLRGA